MSRGTIARLERALDALRRAQPEFYEVVWIHDGEPEEAYRARLAESERRAEAAEAAGRKAFLIIVDREPEEVP